MNHSCVGDRRARRHERLRQNGGSLEPKLGRRPPLILPTCRDPKSALLRCVCVCVWHLDPSCVLFVSLSRARVCVRVSCSPDQCVARSCLFSFSKQTYTGSYTTSSETSTHVSFFFCHLSLSLTFSPLGFCPDPSAPAANLAVLRRLHPPAGGGARVFPPPLPPAAANAAAAP